MSGLLSFQRYAELLQTKVRIASRKEVSEAELKQKEDVCKEAVLSTSPKKSSKKIGQVS